MTPAALAVRRKAHAWPGKVLLVAIILTVLAYGSASPLQSNVAAFAFAVIAMLASLSPIGASRTGRVRTTSALLLAGLLAYAALQALPLANVDWANGAWKSVNETVGAAPSTISVAPGMTIDALPSLALPFLAFVSALTLFQGDEGALTLWRALAYFGAAYAAFGILQQTFFPERLLFEPKPYYLGSLTATFVNRNTAGTFFGVALLLNLGPAFHELRKIRVADFAAQAHEFDAGWRARYGRALIHWLLCLVVAVALFLTQSRGAVGATFVACVAAILLMTMRSLTADPSNENSPKWRRSAALGAGVLAGVFALFAGRSLYRMAEHGVDDARWCGFASTIEAIKDNWIFGAGFGAFQDVFPMYRKADCAGIFGIWERAHNVFLEGYLGLGLPFLPAIAVGYFVLLRAFRRGVRARHKFRFMPVMGLAALLLTTLHSLVDFSLQIPGFAVYFAAAMAAAVTGSLERAYE